MIFRSHVCILFQSGLFADDVYELALNASERFLDVTDEIMTDLVSSWWRMLGLFDGDEDYHNRLHRQTATLSSEQVSYVWIHLNSKTDSEKYRKFQSYH